MGFERLNEDISFISRLPDEPNEALGMSAEALKKEFDRAGEALKNYINSRLLPALEGQNAADSLGMSAVEGLTGVKTVQQALEKLERQLREVSAGSMPEGSVGKNMLSPAAVSEGKIADMAVTENKLSDGAVTEAKLAQASVSGTKLRDSCVGEAKIAEGAVTESKLSPGAVSSGRIAAAPWAPRLWTPQR